MTVVENPNANQPFGQAPGTVRAILAMFVVGVLSAFLMVMAILYDGDIRLAIVTFSITQIANVIAYYFAIRSPDQQVPEEG